MFGQRSTTRSGWWEATEQRALPALRALGLTIGYCVLAVLSALVLMLLAPVVVARQWWGGWRQLPPSAPPARGGKLAVIIPACNEAPSIGAIVSGVPRADIEALGFEPWIIVVDDGSQDGSGGI